MSKEKRRDIIKLKPQMTAMLLSYLKETVNGFGKAIQTIEAQHQTAGIVNTNTNAPVISSPSVDHAMDENTLRMKAGYKLLTDLYTTIQDQVRRGR